MVGANPAPGPLSDVRVLDVAGEAGVFASRLLADLGADVIRVEPPAGDPVRRRRPFLGDIEGPERSLYHLHFNLNKRGVTLDIRSAAGGDVLRRLVSVSDALIETGAPGAMEALGLGFEDLLRVNPALLYAAITPFGQDGPLRDYRGNDLVGIATSGVTYLNGFPEDPPNQPGAEQAYHMASLAAATGLMVALTGRERGNAHVGRRIDVSLQEAASMATLQTASANYYTWHRRVPTRRGLGTIYRHVFQCADGAWISFVAPPPARWPALMQWFQDEGIDAGMEGKEWDDPAYRLHRSEVVAKAMEDLVSRHTREELFHEGQRRKLMVMPVNSAKELVEDRQLQERGFFVRYRHEALDRELVDCGPAAQMSGTPLGFRRPAPRLGEHNHEVYVGLLGMTQDEVARLASDGII